MNTILTALTLLAVLFPAQARRLARSICYHCHRLVSVCECGKMFPSSTPRMRGDKKPRVRVICSCGRFYRPGDYGYIIRIGGKR